MSQHPKVFISHASEDKVDYALPLATALMSLGVDVWLDTWEIKPGDSLVSKIFEEGLGDAQTCVYLMSPNSIGKAWVRAEFDAAVAQRIEGNIRLIPVKLRKCDVPIAVRSIFWLDFKKLGSVERVAEEIAKAVHGHSDKPAIGPKPLWVDARALRVQGLDKQDQIVLGIVFQASLSKGSRRFIQSVDLAPLAKQYGVNEELLKESIDMLVEAGYLKDKSRGLGGRNVIVDLYPGSFLSIARHLGLAVDECEIALAGLILNEEVGEIRDLHERLSQYPAALTESLLDAFQDSGWLKVSRTLGGGGFVHGPSIPFKRWFRDQTQ